MELWYNSIDKHRLVKRCGSCTTEILARITLGYMPHNLHAVRNGVIQICLLAKGHAKVGLGLPHLCLWVGVPLHSCTVILTFLFTGMLAMTVLWLVDMTGAGGQCPMVHDTSFCGFSIVIGASPTCLFPYWFCHTLV